MSVRKCSCIKLHGCFTLAILTNKLPHWVTESHEAATSRSTLREYNRVHLLNNAWTLLNLLFSWLSGCWAMPLVYVFQIMCRVDRATRAPPAVHRKGASHCRRDGWGRQMRSFLSQTSLDAPPSAEQCRGFPLVSTLTGVQLIGWKPPRWLWAERSVSPLVPGWLRAVRLKGPGPQWRNGECARRERWSRSNGPRASGTGPEYSKMGSTPRRCPGTSQFILTRWVDLLFHRTICSPP